MKKAKYFQIKPDYPEIKVSKPNPYYANLIRDSYAGKDSELTKISQYLYHYFIINDINKEIASVLYNIAKVEMKHMEILAKLIMHLEGDPLLRGGEENSDYWSSENVYYGINIYDMLRRNLSNEHKAINNYENYILIIQDVYVKDIFKQIIEDEVIHIELLNKLIHDYFR